MTAIMILSVGHEWDTSSVSYLHSNISNFI